MDNTDWCECCGEGFSPSVVSQKFCSKKCKSRYKYLHPKHSIKTCIQCGRDYTPKRIGTKCCSRECGFKYQAATRQCARERRMALAPKPKKKTCEVCEREFYSINDKRRTCGAPICMQAWGRTATYRYIRSLKEQTGKVRECVCRRCGKTWLNRYGVKGTKWCSVQCNRAELKRERKSRIRLHANGKRHRIYRAQLYNKNHGRCQICKAKLKLTTKVPESLAPTVDHIVPLSCGGSHTWENVQLACFHCNTVKKNRSVPNGEQLWLFGKPMTNGGRFS